jgi:hypothetical protein
MSTQTYLVAVTSIVLMITNLLGAAFTISRLRSRHMTAAAPVDQKPTGASLGPRSPNRKSKATAGILVRVGAFQLLTQGIGIVALGIALVTLLKIL